MRRNIILSENILFHIYLNFLFRSVVFNFYFLYSFLSVYFHFAEMLGVCCATDDMNSILKSGLPVSTNIHYYLLLLFSRKELIKFELSRLFWINIAT